jgi:hypothetical protein
VSGLAASAVTIAALLVFVFPTRTYLAQRQQLADAAGRVRILAGQNQDLSNEINRLQTDAEIERLAREQYHLVRPGEQAYAILPAPAPTTTTTTPGSAAAGGARLSWWQSAWHRVSSLL